MIILGETAGGLVYPVRINDDHNLIAAGYGYYLATWRKNPLQFGISGQVIEDAYNLNLAAGTNVLSTTPVPNNTIHVITQISCMYTGTVTSVRMIVTLKTSGSSPRLFGIVSPVSSQPVDRQGWWVLLPTNYLTLTINSATLNDDGWLEVAGFSIAYTA